MGTLNDTLYGWQDPAAVGVAAVAVAVVGVAAVVVAAVGVAAVAVAVVGAAAAAVAVVGVAAVAVAVAAAPVPEILKGQAAEHFLEMFTLSKAASDEWVMTHDVAKIVELFQMDKSIANFYLIFSKSSNESALCSWICDEILPRVTL